MSGFFEIAVAKFNFKVATPWLVINESVVSTGRILDEAEITTFLTNALVEADRD